MSWLVLHIDRTRVQPLVSDDGTVFYRLERQTGGIGEITVLREIIHDRMNCLFHPLVGTPPVFASGLASMLGLNAQRASARCSRMPDAGGILTRPARSARRRTAVQGAMGIAFLAINLGRVAVMTGGAKYEKWQ